MNNCKAVAYQPNENRGGVVPLHMPDRSQAGIERTVEINNPGIASETSFGRTPPPTPEELDRQLRSATLRSFGQELQAITNAPFLRREASRYRNVKEDLKILYYGGHGRLTRNRSLAWARSAGRSKYQTVKWSGIQNVLEEAQSGVLLLLDCCHSGISNTDEGRGITELLASSDYHFIANGVGPFSFRHALVIELLKMPRHSRFSVLELYNNIYFRIQGRMPEDGRERHPAPVHLVLTNSGLLRQRIEFSIRPDTTRR
ncbi:hypothetical protein BDZ45DRAFT_752263 [Acephala macrosclerotiorum]|nr:hypothetical protein BDZ45DRAFT_752263 [Acephala macrosclerotiorum]